MANPAPDAAASPAPAPAPATQPAPMAELPSRPAAVKKARLPQGAKMISRSLNAARNRPPANVTREDPHLAPKRRIEIRRGTPLVAILKRVQKLLDKSPRGVLSQSLHGASSAGGVAAKRRSGAGSGHVGRNETEDGGAIAAGDERFDVLVVGTGGQNIEKALKTAAVFQRRGDCVVRLYTNTVSGVDTYECDEERSDDDDGVDGGGAPTGDADIAMSGVVAATFPPAGHGRVVSKVVKQRPRKASSLEVGIRLR
ncbi:hypothetical protein MAPG_02108 [Magnaporthiopsis poae ATCC 64411]|uniref:Uncharacterized protein n=1 Tax=Magnaporthiopsis poae (strain ATCC 64411 / 73-15) TaxID=644358 RepID=A0A0C4DQG8_MAGP6|nr:hypothetical protein MAPG_02108 [Magnaporthiopsis poae ATCC 64411]